MKRSNLRYITLAVLALLVLVTGTQLLYSEANRRADLAKPSEFMHAQFNGNTIANWLANDGLIVSHRKTGNSGMEWPKGSKKTIDFASGIWFVGKDADGVIRTAAAEYSSEFVPGPYGSDPTDPANRIYIINSDGTGDWDSWPIAQGAPSEGGKPKMLGDQTMFWVMNDGNSAQHANVFSTQPMGLEVRCTVFGFDKADPLGNIMFMNFEVFNKGGLTLDSCYVALWDDPDLGDASDDLVACDTTLSLGYCYNGKPVDATYGTTPPAIGMDFHQGPLVDGEYMPMTSFVYYWNGAPDPYGDPEDAGQMFSFMKGFTGDGSPYTDHTGAPTKFVFAGDPVTGSGHLDSNPADRRFLMSSGPFTLKPGDRQVIVGSKIIAPGTDNLSAVNALRFFDSFAQNAFDNNFDLPQPPAPIVKTTALDETIILVWQDETEKFKEIESYDFSGYKFEGYNIYQGESESGPWKLVATIDAINDYGIVFDQTFDAATGLVLEKPVAFGSNSGITRNFAITKDYLTGTALYNYKKYYFSVNSYAVNPDVSPKVAESGFKVLTVMPATPPLGQQQTVEQAAMFTAEHVAGVSNGSLKVMVVDPTKVTNHTYQVTFEDLPDGTSQWYVYNKTTGKKLGGPFTNQSGGEDYPIFDGLKFYVTGAPLAFAGDGNGIIATSFAGAPSAPDARGGPFGGDCVWHALNNANDLGYRYYLSATGSGDISRLMRWIQFAVPFDYELRFTEAGGYGIYAFEDDKIAKVPFELWNIGSATPDDPSDDFRMIPFLLSSDETPSRDQWGWATGTDNYFGYPASDAIYWMDPEGVDGYAKFQAACEAAGIGNTYPAETDGSSEGYWVNWHGGFVYPIGRLVVGDYSGSGTPPPAGTTIRFITTKPNSSSDVFEIQAPAFLVSAEVAKEQLDQINVVPNPYWAWSPNEKQPTTRIIRFTHMPTNGATIRIFDLAGNLVRTITDADREAQGSLGTAYAEWDARNAADVPVASGMYIVHVTVKDVGEKILKLAVINREERLLYY